jgi:large subunit ribosomal protein L27
VRYYRDPLQHPKRQYIGVALSKEDTLPYPRNAARRRRLNMVTSEFQLPQPVGSEETLEVVGDMQVGDGTGSITNVRATPKDVGKGHGLLMSKKGYAFREANWAIGRAAERAGVQVNKFVPGDRWAAWRKSQARIKTNLENKKLRNAGKKAKPAKQRKRG